MTSDHKTTTDLFIEKYFVDYTIAKELQLLGFNEAAFAWTTDEVQDIVLLNRAKRADEINLPTKPFVVPSYDQTILWLQSKNIHILFDIEADYDDRDLNYDITHDQIETTVTGYNWSIYPNFFTENDGQKWFDAKPYHVARYEAILKAIEILKNNTHETVSHSKKEN